MYWEGCQRGVSRPAFTALSAPERMIGSPGTKVLALGSVRDIVPMKFVLVDDHFLIREALRGILQEVDASATIVEASCWRDGSRLIDEAPDAGLVLLDLVLPDQDGLAALAETRQRHPKIPVVILSAQCDRDN